MNERQLCCSFVICSSSSRNMYGNFFNNSGFLLITSICAESITAKEQYRHNGVKLFLEEVYTLNFFLKMERIISKVHKYN